MSEWLTLISFICGALGLFSVGVSTFRDVEDHDRRITQIEAAAATLATERNETNVRLARIEERLNAVLSRKD